MPTSSPRQSPSCRKDAIAVKKRKAELLVALSDAIGDLKARGVIDRLLSENIARVKAAASKRVY